MKCACHHRPMNTLQFRGTGGEASKLRVYLDYEICRVRNASLERKAVLSAASMRHEKHSCDCHASLVRYLCDPRIFSCIIAPLRSQMALVLVDSVLIPADVILLRSAATAAAGDQGMCLPLQ